MWKSRRKSLPEIENTNRSLSRSPSNLTFVRSSLKDVVNLFSDDICFNKTLDQPPPYSTATAIATATATTTARRLSIFHRVHLANKFARAFTASQSPNSTKSLKSIKSPPDPNNLGKTRSVNRLISLPGSENRIVMYTTSLRVVRSTFEACRTVKSILRSFRVSIDERDLSMDSNFLTELQAIMAEGGEDEIEAIDRNKLKLSLPRVFIGGKYVGGVEEVKELHESGELKKVVERLPAVAAGVCEVCGDFRFVVCDECSGSHKCYSEKCGLFRSCTLCNENGLVRCSFCLGC